MIYSFFLCHASRLFIHSTLASRTMPRRETESRQSRDTRHCVRRASCPRVRLRAPSGDRERAPRLPPSRRPHKTYIYIVVRTIVSIPAPRPPATRETRPLSESRTEREAQHDTRHTSDSALSTHHSAQIARRETERTCGRSHRDTRDTRRHRCESYLSSAVMPRAASPARWPARASAVARRPARAAGERRAP